MDFIWIGGAYSKTVWALVKKNLKGPLNKKNNFISQRKVNVIVHVILTKLTNYNKNIKQLFRIIINKLFHLLFVFSKEV